MKLRYKHALMSDDGEYFWLEIANCDADVRRISNYAGFVRWLSEEWQEVEI